MPSVTEIVLFEFIDRSNRIAYLVGGRAIPITKFVDEFGDEVDDTTEAHAIIAGPLPDGRLAAIEIADFDSVTIQ